MCRNLVSKQKRVFVGVSCFLFLVLAVFGNSITPDYLIYKEIVDEVAATKDPFVHVENFYIELIHFIGNHFYIYQFCIFIPSFFCLYLIIRLVQLERPTLFFAIFVVFFLYGFIGGRAFLFNTVYMLSITLIARKHFFIGILLLTFSLFLHKLAYIALPLTILFFLRLRFNWKILLIGSGLFVCLVIIGREIITNSLSDTMQLFAGVKGINYLTKTEGANAGGSFWWQIIYAYHNCIKYSFSFIAIYNLRTVLKLNIFSTIRVMYDIVLWSTLISLYVYCIGLPDTTIASRIFSIGSIPLCYLYAKLPDYIQVKQWHRVLAYFICIFYLIFNNAYIVGVSHSTLG